MTKKQKIYLGIAGLVFVLGGGFLVFGQNGNGNIEKITVQKRYVVEEVHVAGEVKAGIVSDIGFDVSGRIQKVLVKAGDEVQEGYPLVTLDIGTLQAELASAQADVAIKSAETKNAETNLAEIESLQNNLVENAYRKLLSSDLVAIPQSNHYTADPPIVSGSYNGQDAGTYKIIIERKNSLLDYELHTFDLETTSPLTISKEEQTPLGTHGLFLEFPSDLSLYNNTIWYVSLPNNKGNSYVANVNAYEEALHTRDQTIADAKAQLAGHEHIGSIAEAELAKALAEVDRIEAEIAKRTLRAPFSGLITKVEADPGEPISGGTIAVSIISHDLGIDIDLPEIDSVKVSLGDEAEVTFDALPGEIFKAHIASINRTETIVDGVSIYEARLDFDTKDERIVSGLTVETVIVTDSKKDVLAIPARAIKEKDSKKIVSVELSDGKIEEKEVVLGLRGSDGFIEIVSGLSEGDGVLIKK